MILTGADAVETAIKLAKTATGRSVVLAFDGAYHGMTHGTLAMMDNLRIKAPVNSLMPDVQFLPYPNLLRCPFGLEGDASIHANLHYLDNLLSNPLSGVLPPAAIILKTSFKPCCGRFLLDIYRPFLNMSRTFAFTVWVIPLSGQITEKNL